MNGLAVTKYQDEGWDPVELYGYKKESDILINRSKSSLIRRRAIC